MALTCAVCGSDKNVNVVCHHCGRPLCEDARCRCLLLEDPAFITPPNFVKQMIRFFQQRFRNQKPSTAVVAFHCPTCKQQYHGFHPAFSNEQLMNLAAAEPARLPPRP